MPKKAIGFEKLHFGHKLQGEILQSLGVMKKSIVMKTNHQPLIGQAGLLKMWRSHLLAASSLLAFAVQTLGLEPPVEDLGGGASLVETSDESARSLLVQQIENSGGGGIFDPQNPVVWKTFVQRGMEAEGRGAFKEALDQYLAAISAYDSQREMMARALSRAAVLYERQGMQPQSQALHFRVVKEFGEFAEFASVSQKALFGRAATAGSSGGFGFGGGMNGGSSGAPGYGGGFGSGGMSSASSPYGMGAGGFSAGSADPFGGGAYMMNTFGAESSIDREIQQARISLEGTITHRKLLEEEMALMGEEIARTNKMHEQGHASRSDLNKVKRQELHLRREMAGLDQQIRKIEQELAYLEELKEKRAQTSETVTVNPSMATQAMQQSFTGIPGNMSEMVRIWNMQASQAEAGGSDLENLDNPFETDPVVRDLQNRLFDLTSRKKWMTEEADQLERETIKLERELSQLRNTDAIEISTNLIDPELDQVYLELRKRYDQAVFGLSGNAQNEEEIIALHRSMEAWKQAKRQRMSAELQSKMKSDQALRRQIDSLGAEIEVIQQEIEKKLKEKRLPVYRNGREIAQKNACFANLMQIQGAIEQWALENKASPQDEVTLKDISGSGDLTKPLAKAINDGLDCPGGGTYSVSDVSSAPTCTVPGHALH